MSINKPIINSITFKNENQVIHTGREANHNSPSTLSDLYPSVSTQPTRFPSFGCAITDKLPFEFMLAQTVIRLLKGLL